MHRSIYTVHWSLHKSRLLKLFCFVQSLITPLFFHRPGLSLNNSIIHLETQSRTRRRASKTRLQLNLLNAGLHFLSKLCASLKLNIINRDKGENSGSSVS